MEHRKHKEKKKISRTDVLRMAQSVEKEVKIARDRRAHFVEKDEITDKAIENALDTLNEIIKFI